ncbi:hypothetical protein [Trichloromonas sp.]|uniref:hypothetical protein n=1 Tax=Trichloromonas sp. TaxID=3069249 RepID=UPI002A41813D|nr:SIS domain-containing protein [Trichloromonas sp.]
MKHSKIHLAVKEQTALLGECLAVHGEELERLAAELVVGFNQGGRLLLAGSGPLGTVAELVADLFLYHLSFERPSLPALALGRDPSLAACMLRDGQGRAYFSRQLRALVASNDLLLVLADASRDEALLDLLPLARQLDCKTALIVPDGAPLAGEETDFLFALKTASPTRLLEMGLFMGQALCELVEEELFGT